MAYEYTAAKQVQGGTQNLHRNVIFRNDQVPADPFSFLDAAGLIGEGFVPRAQAAPLLYDALEAECLDGIEDCDVLTIPHNPNLSGGAMFDDPATAEEAARRASFEPLVEVFQTKGGSECRTGVGTTDEDCGFELMSTTLLGALRFGGPQPPDAAFPERNFVRNVLKEGLALEQELGVNPFKYGMVGSTDNHSGIAGDTAEANFSANSGNHGLLTADPVLLPVGQLTRTTAPNTPINNLIGAAFNPGGLAVVWAEENSRDSLFEAMRRREAYGTSGTRITVRFFGSWKKFKDDDGEYSLNSTKIIKKAYKKGVPMGADLPPKKGKSERKPSFLVLAAKDPGTGAGLGTDLQRIQIVKGWVDESGQTHEQVYEVAGDPGNGAGVNPATCTPVGAGYNELGAEWEDEGFDPDRPAFYYARVFENPTCRRTTLECLQFGVNPLADPATCAGQEAAVPGLAGGVCCVNEDSPERFQPVIQERAWTSPIWYTP